MRASYLAPLVAVAVVVTACTSAPDALPTTTTTTTTTIVLNVRSTAESPVVVGTGVDDAVAEGLRSELDVLRSRAEQLRGLGFIGPPRIALLEPAAFDDRRNDYLTERFNPADLAIESRLLQLLGLAVTTDEVTTAIRQATAAPATAYYDPSAGELVVRAERAALDEGSRSVVVRELVLLLTDQYHSHAARAGELTAAGRLDEALALETLAAADAMHAQLRYVDGLPATERAAAVRSIDVPVAAAPETVAVQLSFAAEEGLPFVDARLADGGLAALDAAYEQPLTTELILHPDRYAAGEGVLEIPVPADDLAGYQVQQAGTMGELRLRSLLVGALLPGMATQTASGWGADRFAVLTTPEEIAFIYTFRGDTVRDAFEVAQAFLDHATWVMVLAEPVAAGGGVEFLGPAPVAPSPTDDEAGAAEGDEGEAPDTTVVAPPTGPYVFVDREGDGLVVVIASTVAAGRQLRGMVAIP